MTRPFIFSLLCICSVFISTAKIAIAQTTLLVDSAAIADIQIKNRIAEHFIEQEPSIAINYADSSSLTSKQVNYKPGLARAYNIKARVYTNNGNYQEALKHYDLQMQVAVDIKDTLMRATTYRDIAQLNMTLGLFDDGIKNYYRSLSLAEQKEDPGLLASLYTSLWTAYWDRNNYDSALYFQNLALAIYRDNTDGLDVTQQLNVMAGTFKKQKNFDRALEYYNRSLALDSASRNKDELAATLNNIAEIYILRGEADQALVFLQRSQEQQLPGSQNSAVVETHFNLGKVYLLKQDYAKAEGAVQYGVEQAKQISSIQHLANGYKLLSDIYEQYEIPHLELEYFKLYSNLRDSLFADELAQQLARERAKSEFNQQQNQINLLEKEQQNSQLIGENQKIQIRNRTILLTLLSIFTAIIGVFLFYILKRNKAIYGANKLLEKQYNEISVQKGEIENQSKIISSTNKALRQAQLTIHDQNTQLKESNVSLEDKVKERTKELKRTFSKLAFHINNTPLAVMEWNKKLELIRWSDQAEKAFGWKSEELLGQKFRSFPIFYGEDKNRLRREMTALIEGQEPRNFFKTVNVDREGNPMIMEWSNSILLNDDGKLESILSIAHDVTDREKALRELKMSNRELDNFIYKASHDLRGPIARMQGVTNLGLMTAADDVSKNYFGLLETVSTELNDILVGLLRVHDINHHKMNPERLKIKQEILSVQEKVHMNGSNLELKLVVDEHLHWSCDRVIFDLIIENLIENAVAYSGGRDSYLRFKVEEMNGSLKINAEDNGMGVPDEGVPKIFDMFFNGAPKRVGTGLGLYMVKKAVDSLNGDIVLLKPANNTTFEIILPSDQD